METILLGNHEATSLMNVVRVQMEKQKSIKRTVCTRSSEPFYLITYYMRWATLVSKNQWGICRDYGKQQNGSSTISPTTEALQENIHARALYSD